MYCANCGAELPEWAHFCDRCGTRVMRATEPSDASQDPLEQVESDDEYVEPLWDDEEAAGAAETGALDLPEAPGDEQDAGGETVAMTVVPEDLDEPEDEEPAAAPSPDAPEPERSPESPEHAGGQHASGSDEQTIDVGEGDLWGDEQLAQGYVSRAWSGRSYAAADETHEPPRVLLICLAALVMGLVSVVLFRACGLIGSPAGTQGPGGAASQAVSAGDAAGVISSLDGWWKTDRSLDGRYWHIDDGLMETYAADGKLAGQVLLDGSSIEHRSSGPGGIEGAGYYLRDIAYYLVDDDPDTLHALVGDGTADEAANLKRTDKPDFMNADASSSADEGAEGQRGEASEYLLPESDTRAYEASELESMSDHDLFVARNEIYARHGYAFETGELSEYFASKSWYHPSDAFSEGALNEVERANVSTILSIEQARGSRYV